MSPGSLLLKGKWVLVTGASKGVGKGIAITYAKQGASIALVARSETSCKMRAGLCHSQPEMHARYHV